MVLSNIPKGLIYHFVIVNTMQTSTPSKGGKSQRLPKLLDEAQQLILVAVVKSLELLETP